MELRETVVLLVVIWAIARLNEVRRPRMAQIALLLITFLDLWVLGRHRLIDVAPLEPLTSQSPVLARLARSRAAPVSPIHSGTCRCGWAWRRSATTGP